MSETSYSYSYEMYLSDADNSKIQPIKLPDNITASGFVDMIRQQNLSNVGKIRIKRTSGTAQKTITLFMDDWVKTASEIKDILKRKYGSVCGTMPSAAQHAPIIITGCCKIFKGGIIPGHNVHINGRFVFKEPKEETWTEPNATLETPRTEDVMVNRELKQIWPVQTGAVPQAVHDFFTNER